MGRCFKNASRKIRAGKKITDLHAHEMQALEDVADFDGLTVAELLESL
jgi:hypothetical protein